jgi:chromosome segregation ATPase
MTEVDKLKAELSAALVSVEALLDEMRSQADVLREVADERDTLHTELSDLRLSNLETQSLLHSALAELDRLTTLRPASEYKEDERVFIWSYAVFASKDARWDVVAVGNHVPYNCMWTPLPDVKEKAK